ncbi:cytochrome P450 [Sphaerisporangium viridialbum]|uniref:cytochrome P450 n=1 Tax=Sphaerisporangium viridialbum TaxID=46189 RepID=UPI003C72CC58
MKPSSDHGLTVTGHAEVCAVLDDPRFIVPPAPGRAGDEEPPGTLGWLRRHVSRFSSGRAHERRRALVRAELHRVHPGSLRSAARDRTVAELERAGEEPLDVMTRLARAVPVAVLGSALGVAEADLEALVRAVTAVAAAYHPGAGAERVARADTSVGELAALLGPGDPEMVANRIGLLVQACDATAGLIGNTLNAALRPPPALRAEWPVDAFAAETLRLDPPVRSTRRTSREGAELGGREVPPGTLVVLDFAAANRDPRVFPDPDRFDPSRPGPRHLTFGYGRRPCPGDGHGLALACGVLEPLLAGYEPADREVAYEPSANLRIPLRLEVQLR